MTEESIEVKYVWPSSHIPSLLLYVACHILDVRSLTTDSSREPAAQSWGIARWQEPSCVSVQRSDAVEQRWQIAWEITDGLGAEKLSAATLTGLHLPD